MSRAVTPTAKQLIHRVVYQSPTAKDSLHSDHGTAWRQLGGEGGADGRDGGVHMLHAQQTTLRKGK